MSKIVFTESYMYECKRLRKIPTEEGQRLHNEAIMRTISGNNQEPTECNCISMAWQPLPEPNRG